MPRIFDQDYTYPTTDEVNYFVGKGMNVFRIPFRWERLQQSLRGELDVGEEARLRTIVEYATKRGASVILDPHNYARYHGSLIGEGPSVADFADFWTRLATLFGPNRRVIFGLMNEPYGIRAEAWLSAANTAIAAIRATGATHLNPGAGNQLERSGLLELRLGLRNERGHDARRGQPSRPLHVRSPSVLGQRFVGDDEHVRFVDDGLGAPGRLHRVARAHGYRGVLGEFGVANDETCLTALRDVLAHMEANADVWHGWTYWAAGPWWGDYRFSIEPDGCADKPQMSVLLDYLP